MEKGLSEQVNEIAGVLKDETYIQPYMNAILYIKDMIDEYKKRYSQADGDSPVQAVEYRVKSAESIADKLVKKGYAISLANAECYLNDLAGVRVVCSTEKDIYSLEDYLRRRDDVTIIRRKDYIKKPKENGYKSLHLITDVQVLKNKTKVRVELQLRTPTMHCWAEADHRSCYKTVNNFIKK